MPMPPIVPAGTGRDRDFPRRHGREETTSDPAHIRLPFSRRWPGWRQVALMGRNDQTIYTHESSEEGFRTMSAVSSESHEPASEPGHRGGAAAPEPAAGQADFGANEWLVEELYQRYLADPGSVDRAWWSFFADYQPTLPNGTGPQPVIARQSAAPAAPAPAPAQPPAPSSPPAAPAPPAQQARPAPPSPAVSSPPSPALSSPPSPPQGTEVSRLRGAAARTVTNMTASLAVPTAT